MFQDYWGFLENFKEEVDAGLDYMGINAQRPNDAEQRTTKRQHETEDGAVYQYRPVIA